MNSESHSTLEILKEEYRCADQGFNATPRERGILHCLCNSDWALSAALVALLRGRGEQFCELIRLGLLFVDLEMRYRAKPKRKLPPGQMIFHVYP